MSGRTVFAAVVMALMVMLGGFVVTIHEQRAACNRFVEVRESARVMWLTVFDMFPESEAVEDLRVALDDQLPRLFCVGRTPTRIP